MSTHSTRRNNQKGINLSLFSNGHNGSGTVQAPKPVTTVHHAAPLPVKSVVAGLEIAPNALEVLRRRYLAKDAEGKVVETPEQMLRRVARNIAKGDLAHDPEADVDARAEQFYRMMAKLEFLPNSPTLMNAGRELQQLSACFVLPVGDSIEEIFEAAKHTAMIHKSGGGTGFSFSRLRPESDRVGSTGGIASGPVSFIRIFDTSTDVIKQGGTRRGANMGILSIDHPDVLKFVHAKDKDDGFLQNFNISVAITEKFMQAVERGEDYDLVNPRAKQPAGKLNAREVFDDIVQSAWKTGDPGIVFIDRINKYNPTPQLGMMESTNPCGEQPLLPYESCNLGSLNLSRMVQDTPSGPKVDWDKLEKTVRSAVRFLDNVITMNKYPIPQIDDMTKMTRKIGLGVMGWADMLILLGIPYNSQEALDAAEQVMKFIHEKADQASTELAQERGVFPAWRESIYGPSAANTKLRNSTRTTIAPTGTISIIGNCSSGIEPLFALSYVRNVMDNTRLVEVNPYFEDVARKEGFFSDELMAELAERGSCQGIPQVPEWVQRVFVTAHDITPEWHVQMQAAFQKYTDNAVSKTVNFANGATVEDVRKVYTLAYKLGCKGVTMYRDGSKSEQVLSTGHTEKVRSEKGERLVPGEATVLRQADEIAAKPVPLMPRERPASVMGVTHGIRTGHGKMYVTINFDESGKPFEVFSNLGKAGGCDSAQLEAISRLVSLALRSGLDIESIIKQLRGITCCPAWDDGVQVRSAPDAVAIALGRHLDPETSKQRAQTFNERTMVGLQLGFHSDQAPSAGSEHAAPSPEAAHHETMTAAPSGRPITCPDCSSKLVYQEGCLLCPGCGFNKCG